MRVLPTWSLSVLRIASLRLSEWMIWYQESRVCVWLAKYSNCIRQSLVVSVRFVWGCRVNRSLHCGSRLTSRVTRLSEFVVFCYEVSLIRVDLLRHHVSVWTGMFSESSTFYLFNFNPRKYIHNLEINWYIFFNSSMNFNNILPLFIWFLDFFYLDIALKIQ